MTCDPVGIQDIAERLGVSADTLTMIRYRGRMPEPQGFVSGTPWWDWPTIKEWAEARTSLKVSAPSPD